MSPRLAWLLIATFALPSLALAQAEQEIVKAIHARLEALRRNDLTTWATLVADDMMAPIEGATGSKQSWLAQRKAWPREVTYWYGPLQDVKVRINGDTAIVTYHCDQLTEVGGQTTRCVEVCVPEPQYGPYTFEKCDRAWTDSPARKVLLVPSVMSLKPTEMSL